MGERALIVVVRRRSNGDLTGRQTVLADPDDFEQLIKIRRDIVTGDGWDEDRATEFEMRVLDARDQNEITKVGG